MPNPKPGESREDFLDRCIPEVVAEGREPDQAVAMCIAYYEGEKDKAFNIKDENRIEYWKAFDRRRITFENKYTRALTRAFKEQLSIYEDAYTINDLKRDISTKPIEDAFVSLYTEVGDVFARNSWAGLKKLPFIETKQQPNWVERLRNAALVDASARIVEITETTRRQINAIIVAGLEEGLGVEEIKRRIIGTTGLQPLNGTLQVRARRIARTEIVSASNIGSLEGALSTGLAFDKQWLSTPDDRTRDAHAEADGQTVDKQAPFLVDGEQLRVPGDPTGSPGNVINCRCTQIYITPES